MSEQKGIPLTVSKNAMFTRLSENTKCEFCDLNNYQIPLGNDIRAMRILEPIISLDGSDITSDNSIGVLMGCYTPDLTFALIVEDIESTKKPAILGIKYCPFCGRPLAEIKNEY